MTSILHQGQLAISLNAGIRCNSSVALHLNARVGCNISIAIHLSVPVLGLRGLLDSGLGHRVRARPCCFPWLLSCLRGCWRSTGRRLDALAKDEKAALLLQAFITKATQVHPGRGAAGGCRWSQGMVLAEDTKLGLWVCRHLDSSWSWPASTFQLWEEGHAIQQS